MSVAAQDQEKTAMDQLKHKHALAEQLTSIFRDIDTTGDGTITQEEFDTMMSKPSIMRKFVNFGLDRDDVYTLFEVLTSDDGEADYHEFIAGVLFMKSSSPRIDAMKTL